MSSGYVQSIPTDVLCDIFHLLCDAPIALHDLKNESHFHEFPWAVGQVCSHWRGVFLSYAPLWASFALKPGAFSAAQFAEMNRRATIYLERSGQHPLTIDVTMRRSYAENFPKSVWRMLLSCLKRWKKVNLVLAYGPARNEFFRCRGYMSSLESLRMSIPNSVALKNYNTFQLASQLIELDLAHPGYGATWQFPWTQLRKLKIETVCDEFKNYGDNLWGVLFQLENIEELHLIIIFSYDFPRLPSSLPIIHLPGLRLLEISLAFAMMFSWFTAPLLEHLHIHGYNNASNVHNCFHNGQPYERELMSLIRRSSFHIRRLALDNGRVPETRILMKALASVEELSVTYPMSTLGVIQDVTGVDGCIYLPKLQVLRVGLCFIRGALVKKAVTAISRLLEARGKGLSLPSHVVAPLEKFVLRLTFRGKFPDGVLEVMHGWPSIAQVYINGSVLERLSCDPNE